jgi:hypothetical protein
MTPETQDIYEKIANSIASLDRDGILKDLHGNCVLASDIIQNMLHAQGISSVILECQLMILQQQADGTSSVNFVGYDFSVASNQISTHAVVMTRSETPLIIDASIGQFLGNARQVVVTECDINTTDPEILGVTQVGDYTLTYRNKKTIKLASRHQKDIMERLRHEYDTIKNIRLLRYLIIGTIFLSTTNFALNISLLLIKITERM